MRFGWRAVCLMALGGLSGIVSLHTTLHAQDRVMGKVDFVSASREAKTSGVWVDGQYVGYLGELKGSNRLRLLPGDHEISVRQAGFSDYSEKVVVEPRAVIAVHVKMERDARFVYPDRKTSSEVRLDVIPTRAAVFLDDTYVGTVDDFYGVEHAMLVAPGKHRFKIALPGFRTFETEVNLFPRQKFALRTDLVGASIHDADPIIKTDPSAASSAVTQARPADAR